MKSIIILFLILLTACSEKQVNKATEANPEPTPPLTKEQPEAEKPEKVQDTFIHGPLWQSIAFNDIPKHMDDIREFSLLFNNYADYIPDFRKPEYSYKFLSNIGMLNKVASNFDSVYSSVKVPENVLRAAVNDKKLSDSQLRKILTFSNLKILHLDTESFAKVKNRLHELKHLEELTVIGDFKTGCTIDKEYFKKLINLKSLTFEFIKGLDIPGNSLFPDLKSFKIRSSSIKEWDFIENLSELQELTFYGMDLPDHSLKKLKELTKLEKLSIINNRLKNENLNKLPKIKSVKELILREFVLFHRYNDKSKSTLSEILPFLPNLEALDIRGRKFKDIDFKGIQHCRNLTSLLTHERIGAKTAKALSMLPKLSLKKLKCATFSESHRVLLKQHSEIEEFDAAETEFSDKDFELLNNFVHLKKLDLSNTKIQKLNRNTLKSLGQLNYLALSSNKITDGALNGISECQNLEFLDLRYTPVSDRIYSEITQCKKLTSVYFDNTKISSCPDFSCWPNLESLGLSDCNLPGRVLINSKRLNFLSINFSKISHLTLLTPKLANFSFSYCDTPIEALCELPELKRINFNEREFSDLDSSLLEKLTNLEYLHVSKCDLARVNRNVKFPKLKSLSIRSSTGIPIHIIEEAEKLQKLEVNSETLPLLKSKGIKPEEIEIYTDKINKNIIKSIPAENLKKLRISGGVKDIDLTGIERFTQLEDLDLSSNNLTAKILASLKKMAALKTLDISNNKRLDWQDLPFWVENALPDLRRIELNNTVVQRRGLKQLLKVKNIKIVDISEKFKPYIPEDSDIIFNFESDHITFEIEL